MERLTRYKKEIFSGLLLLLFLWYLGGISLFQHSHIIDGQIIVHSHPYTGTADHPGHTHTPTQLLSIAQMPQMLAPDAGVPPLPAVFYFFAAVCLVFLNLHPPRTGAFHYTLRGPPAC